MSGEAPPSSSPEPHASEAGPALELEPIVAAATQSAPPRVATAPRAATIEAAQSPRTAARDRRRISTSVLTSVTIHLVFFVLLFLLMPGYHPETPPEEPFVIHVNLRDWHWIGDAPEADGTGPRGPDPAAEPSEPPKGPEVAPGFLEDDTSDGTSIGVGGAAMGSAFAGRVDGREGLVASGGGDGGTEGAVHMALEWLARHQETDGTWNARTYVKRCPEKGCEGACDEDYVTASTALALLPYLGAGHTHQRGPWKDTVRRGLTALRKLQRPDGRFEDGPKRAYSDALATLALTEAYGLTKNESLGEMARRSVAFWVSTQNAEGGWRYEPHDRDGDTSVTGWVGMALASARKAGIAVPDKTIARCRGFIRSRTDDDGVVGYTSRGTGSKGLLGVGYFVPVMLGSAPDDPVLAATGARLEAATPRWSDDPDDPATLFGVADPLHWYYGALAAFQRGGTTWKLWNDKLRPLLVGHQNRTRCSAGSWAPVGQTGAKGGRLVVTALCAMSLEVYYRYPR